MKSIKAIDLRPGMKVLAGAKSYLLGTLRFEHGLVHADTQAFIMGDPIPNHVPMVWLINERVEIEA